MNSNHSTLATLAILAGSLFSGMGAAADEPSPELPAIARSDGTEDYQWFEPPAHYVGFSPDSSQLLAAWEPERGRSEFAIADVASRRIVRRFAGHDSPWMDKSSFRTRMRHAIFSPDQKKVVTIVSNDQAVKLWDVQSGKELSSFTFQTIEQSEAQSKAAPIQDLDSPVVIAGEFEGYDLAITVRSYVRMYRLAVKGDQIVEMQPARVMEHVGRGFTRPTSHVYKVASYGHQSSDAFVAAFGIWDSKFEGGTASPSYLQLAFVRPDLAVEPQHRFRPFRIPDHAHACDNYAIAGDFSRRTIACGVGTGFCLAKPNGARFVGAHRSNVRDIAMDAQGRWVATTALEKNVRIWDQAKARRVKEIDDFKNRIERLALSPDGVYLATASHEGVKLFNLEE